MELSRYARFVTRNLPIVLGTAILAALVAGIVTALQPARHEARLQLLLTLKDQRNLNTYDYDQFYALQAAELSSSNVVSWLNSADVADQIRTDANVSNGRIESRKNGGTVEVTTLADSDDQARALADATARQITNRTQALAAASPNRSSFTVTPSTPLVTTTKPDAGRAAGFGFIAGLLAGLAAALVREGTSRRLRGVEMIKHRFDRVVVGKRSVQPTIDGHGLEPYRVLREMINVPKGLIVVSDLTGRPGEIAFGLGVATARTGASVLLVDADLAGGRLHTLAGVTGTNGLNELLHGSKLSTLTQKTSLSHLKVLPAGSPNAHVDMTAGKVRSVAADLKKSADIVIVSTSRDHADLLAWHAAEDGHVVALERDVTSFRDAGFAAREAAHATAFWLG